MPARPRAARRPSERAVQLPARLDGELDVDVAQVPLHGAPAEEEPRPDLRVREPVAGELGDLSLLRGQLVARLGAALLGARVAAPVLPAQPFAVEQVRARELGAEPRAPEARDRLAVERVRVAAVGHERAGAGLDAEGPVGGA